MTETSAPAQKTNEFISRRLKISGFLIIAGLLVEGLSLLWNHPLSFVTFLGLGGLFLATGIVLYLWTLVSHTS
jgi:asparagine N-glycosylation enzyme membrane subunit Stt3